MKAVVYKRYGTTSQLHVEEIAKPTPQRNEVLIRIHATTVNRTDCGFLSGLPHFVRLFSGLTRPKRQVLGSEFAGVVEEVGADVRLFNVGDRVFGLTGMSFGTHAEYVCRPEDSAIDVMPSSMSFDEAASICDGAMLAWTDVHAFGLRRGQQILINGASGSIGSAAVQLARHEGLEVTAVCKTEAIDRIRALGADHVIDYTAEDFTKRYATYDVVFDAVGKSSYFKCKHLLKPQGTYCSTELGFLSQNPFLALWFMIIRQRRVIFPIPKETKALIMYVRSLVEQGEYRALIDRVYTLDTIVDAYHYVQTGEKIGNVVIDVADNS